RNEIGELTQSFNQMVKGLREMKELEERLRQSEHLSQIGQLASGIAHEVRNPLNMVNLSIDHIRSKYPPDDPQAREEFLGILSGIKGEVHRLNAMISNFLDYGKPVRLSIALESLPETLNEVLSLAGEKLREQGVIVQKSFQSNLPPIPMDKKQIKTCFMNLVLNAIQAMPEGGRLSVEASCNQDTAVVKIKDSGVGITPENAVKIFEPYFTTKEAGIGLGLALTKRIIEEHGGRILIDSGENIGTEVLVEMPLQREG
ncbi:MAG: ATP-binding protein, partial [Nitrospirota bacterium]|nr:ATP-binding protein [Nitrospirota bacterium]